MGQVKRKGRTQAARGNGAQRPRLSGRDWLEVLAVMGLLTLIVLGVKSLGAVDVLPLRHVDIQGQLRHVSRAALERVGRRARAGFLSVDLRRVERDLKALPWVKGASVRRRWPDTLVVRVREREPVARWGKRALLSRDGTLFRPAPEQFPVGLPVLYGPPGAQHALLARLRGVRETLRPTGLGVKALVEDERRAWHLFLDNDIPVAVGRGDPSSRVARFARVYAETLATRAEHIEAIDLRYTNGLAVAWKSSASPRAQRKTALHE